jgi:hypothetical protein
MSRDYINKDYLDSMDMEELDSSIKKIKKISPLFFGTKMAMDLDKAVRIIKKRRELLKPFNENTRQLDIRTFLKSKNIDVSDYDDFSLSISEIKKIDNRVMDSEESLISDYEYPSDRQTMLNCLKYFNSNNDFINLMKVSKNYQDIVDDLDYNPISDISLFKNLLFQHHYNKDEQIYSKALKHIVWYQTDELYNLSGTQVTGDIEYKK